MGFFLHCLCSEFALPSPAMIILPLLHTSHNPDRFTQLFSSRDSHLSLHKKTDQKSTRRKCLPPSLLNPLTCLHLHPPSPGFLLLQSLQPQNPSWRQGTMYSGSLSFSPCWEPIASELPLTPSSIFNLLSIGIQTGSILSNLKMKTKKPTIELRNLP